MLQVDMRDVLFWGLNVRMALATGTAEAVAVGALPPQAHASPRWQ